MDNQAIMHRRTAIKTTLTGLAGLALLPAHGASTAGSRSGDRPLGVQLFTIPKLVEADLPGTLALLGDIGYREVEFFGPYPFSTDATKEEFKRMAGMLGLQGHAFYGYSAEEVAGMLRANNLTAPSVHANIRTLRGGLDRFLDGVAPLAPKYAVIPALFEGRDTLEDYQRLADEFNEIGRNMAAYGMKLLYHNHGYEHAEKGGAIPMNVLLENTDKNYVQFELDIFWMAAAGADPVDYLTRYPGRYKALHLKDAAEVFRFRGDGGSPDQWMPGFPKMADPGTGVFDIPAIIRAAELNGVDHYFLERDLAPEPVATLKNSYGNLVAIK